MILLPRVPRPRRKIDRTRFTRNSTPRRTRLSSLREHAKRRFLSRKGSVVASDNGALPTFNINRCSTRFTKKGTRNRFARSLAKVPKATAAPRHSSRALSAKISVSVADRGSERRLVVISRGIDLESDLCVFVSFLLIVFQTFLQSRQLFARSMLPEALEANARLAKKMYQERTRSPLRFLCRVYRRSRCRTRSALQLADAKPRSPLFRGEE